MPDKKKKPNWLVRALQKAAGRSPEEKQKKSEWLAKKLAPKATKGLVKSRKRIEE